MKKLITALSILCASFALQAAYSDYYVMFSVCAPGQIPIAKSSIFACISSTATSRTSTASTSVSAAAACAST